MIEKLWRKSPRRSTWIFGASRGFQSPGAGNAPAPDDCRFAPSPFSAFAPGTGFWFRAVFWIFLFLLIPRTDPVHAQLTLEKRLISEVENVSEGGILEFSLALAVPPAEAPLSLRLADDLPTLDGLWEPVAARVTAVGEGLSGAALQPGDSGEFQDLRFGDGRPDRVLFDFGSVAVLEGAGETGANRISVEISARAVSAVTPTLAHWWRLDDDTGTAAADAGAAAETRDGTLVNMAANSWIPDGRRGGGLGFDPGGDAGPGFVRLAADGQLPLRPDRPYTISLWFRTTGPGALLAKAGGTPEERQVYLLVNSGSDSLQAFVGGVFFPVIGVNVRDGQWHLATLVNDPAAGTATLYLDAGTDLAVATPGDAVNGADVLLGVRRETDENEGTAFPFTGDMDDVRIYSAPLSADQVRTLFRAESANRARATWGDAAAEAFAPVTVVPAQERIALSGRVGADANGDGAISGDEGLAGVWLVLSDLEGTPVAVQITDDRGRYRFSDLSPGGWRIVVDVETLPGGLVPAQDPQGPADGAAVLENVSAARDGLDFVYREGGAPDPPDPPEPPDPPDPPNPPEPPPAGAISGRVWLDENGNGLEEEDEPGAPDVVLELRSTAGIALRRTRTGSGGGYGFQGIFPGDYRLGVIPPEGFRLTSNDAEDPARNSDFDPETGAVSVAVRDGATLENLDAGLVPDRIVLAGRVWLDGDGEIGASDGVLGVRLVAESEETAPLVVRTDEEGAFRFEELPPGTWTVSVEPATLPEFAEFSREPDGTPDGRVVLGEVREDRLDLDFRLRSTRSAQPADLSGTRILGMDLDGPPLLPGDELEFWVVVYNAGDRSATDVIFFGETPEWTSLQPETVDTDRGAVTVDGPDSFRVFLGELEAGGEAWIRWRGTVQADAPAGGWVIAGGRVGASGLAAVPVDAAETTIPDDPLVLGPIGGPAGEDAAGVSLAATQTVSAAGPVAPGERLRFETTLTATGVGAAEDVRLFNAVPLWTELDPASVFGDRGEVDPGNPIQFSMDSLSPGETIRFGFEAVVRADVPEHSRISSQALVLAKGLRARSDDPGTAEVDDPTVVWSDGPVPALRLWMEFAEPLRSAGLDSRERTLSARVVNLGDSPARNVRFLDAPLGAFRLIPGTVTSDRGRVIRGNGETDQSVQVELGDLAPGKSATVAYAVEIEPVVAAFPAQEAFFLFFRNGWIRADGFPDIRGDDPATHAEFDGTATIFVGFP
jgi:hypothetical protein